MRLREIVEARHEELTEADRKVAEVLLADRTAGSFLAAHEVALKAGVHQSTAGRLARKLGFDSYREMREELRSAIISDLDASLRVRKRLDRVGHDSILQSVVDGEMRALAALPGQITQAQIDAATDRLRRADGIIVVGESHSSSLAGLFARRLVRSGYRATALAHVDWEAADALLGLAPADLIFGMVFRHGSPNVEKVFEHARSIGAATILVTDRVSAPPSCAEITLAARRGEVGESHSMTVPMAICNTIILELSRTDDGRSLARLGKLERLRRMFDERGARSIKV